MPQQQNNKRATEQAQKRTTTGKTTQMEAGKGMAQTNTERSKQQNQKQQNKR